MIKVLTKRALIKTAKSMGCEGIVDLPRCSSCSNVCSKVAIVVETVCYTCYLCPNCVEKAYVLSSSSEED
jgi:hypothetical protein